MAKGAVSLGILALIAARTDLTRIASILGAISGGAVAAVLALIIHHGSKVAQPAAQPAAQGVRVGRKRVVGAQPTDRAVAGRRSSAVSGRTSGRVWRLYN